MTDLTRSESGGNWAIHFFGEDFRRILSDLDREQRRSTPAQQAVIDRTLNELFHFCVSNGDLQVSADSPISKEVLSSPVVKELLCFSACLRDEFPQLDFSDQPRVRRALRRTLIAHRRGRQPTLNRYEFVLAIISVAAWISIFAIGYTVHAKPYENVLMEPRIAVAKGWEIPEFVGALFMFILASVPTNVLMLACIAGVIGTAYRRAKLGYADQRISPGRDYMFSVTASFFIYIALLAGLLTLTVADTVTAETQEKQIQLAGTASILAFVVGYDRKLLVWMLQRAAKLLVQADSLTEPTGARPIPPPGPPKGVSGAAGAPKAVEDGQVVANSAAANLEVPSQQTRSSTAGSVAT